MTLWFRIDAAWHLVDRYDETSRYVAMCGETDRALIPDYRYSPPSPTITCPRCWDLHQPTDEPDDEHDEDDENEDTLDGHDTAPSAVERKVHR